MNRIKVAFLGNCQGEFLQGLFSSFKDTFEVVRTPPLYMQTMDYAADFMNLIQNVDFVVSRHFSEDFRLVPARTTNLKETIGDRLIVFPNLYFNGYFSDFFVAYGSNGRALPGPIGDYHSRTVYNGFKNGMKAADVVGELKSSEGVYASRCLADSSFAELGEREKDCDVMMSDYIKSRWQTEPLFYTYNHPNNILLNELANRILKKMKVEVSVLGDPMARYALDEVILPIYPSVASKCGLQFTIGSNVFKVRPPKTRHDQQKDQRPYEEISLDEYVDKCYSIYQEQVKLTA